MNLSITRLFGIELEFFLINSSGQIVNQSDILLKKLKNNLQESTISKEAGSHMIELISFPHRTSRDVYVGFFEDMETLLSETYKNGLGLYNYACYPGINKGKTRTESRYQINSKIKGKGMKVATTCIGFHYHYSLPRNVFNKNILFFYPDIKQRKRQKVTNLFNLYIALDPAIATFMQSSPYFEGQYLGKSSRVIVYRSDPIFNCGIKHFYDYPDFTLLNDYAENYEVLINRITKRAELWKKLLDEKGVTFSEYTKNGWQPSLLDTSWKPVKISAHGTIESRGSDMNDMNKIVSLSSIITMISKFVQNNFIQVTPGSIGNDEPFKLEGDKLYVPEFNVIKNKLQYYSAIDGFENYGVYKYCKSLLNLVKDISKPEARAPLRVFLEMAENKKSKSDEILDFVKKKQGYTDYKTIHSEVAEEFAINASENIYKDLILTKKLAETNLMFN